MVSWFFLIKNRKICIAISIVVLAVAISARLKAAAKDYEIKPAPVSCPGDPNVIVNLGGIKLAVPRKPGATVYFKPPKPDHQKIGDDCWVHFFGDAMSVKIGQFVIGAPSDRTRINLLKPTKDDLEQAQRDSQIMTLSDGVQHIEERGHEYFILPIDKAPTKSGDPIVMDCNGNSYNHPIKDDPRFDEIEWNLHNCYINYIHPIGLTVLDRFSRGDYPRGSDYLEADQKIRQRIEAMLKAAQEPSENNEEKKQ